MWDARLDDAGTRLVEAREPLVAELTPLTAEHYSRLAGATTEVGLAYVRSWSGPLLGALAEARTADLKRGCFDHWAPPGRVGADRGGTAGLAPMRPRGSSGHWPSLSNWLPTSWPLNGSALPPCSYWTTCSPNLIPDELERSWRAFPRARPC